MLPKGLCTDWASEFGLCPTGGLLDPHGPVCRDCQVTSAGMWIYGLEEGAEAGKVTFTNRAPTPAPREGRVLQGLHCFCYCMEHLRHKSSRTRSHCSLGKGDLDNALPKKGLIGFGADRRRE